MKNWFAIEFSIKMQRNKCRNILYILDPWLTMYYNLVLQLQPVLQATLSLIALLQILPLSHGTLHPLTNKMDSFVTMSLLALQLEVAPWSTRLQTLLKSPFKTCYLTLSTDVLLLPLPLPLDQQVSYWPSHFQKLVSELCSSYSI